MKILVIGGMHGNEPLGIALADKFLSKPIKGIDAVIANPAARAINERFVAQDLNRSFPGQSDDDNFEVRRAAELIEITKKYDVVLDFHNTTVADNDCSFVGESANPELYDISLFLGLNRVIKADYDCLNKYAPNCLSVEVSLSSPLNSANLWYGLITKLANTKLTKAENIEIYMFVYRLTLNDKRRLRLGSQQLPSFKPVEPSMALALGLRPPIYPIFAGDSYTPYNYGGLLERLQ